MPILSKLRLKRAFSKLDHQLEKLPKQMSQDELLDFVFSPKGSLIEPWQFREEIDALTKEIEKIKPKFAMEIGTANGGTLFLLSRLSDPNAKIMSVDLPEGQFGGGYPEWKTSFYKKFALPGQQLQLKRGDSHAQSSLEEAKTFFGQDMLDYLFIDGDHTYEGVKQDYEMYSPLVRKGGMIVFHDIAEHKGSHCQVDKFWHEVKVGKTYKEFVNDWNQGYYGIGVIIN
jgi:predicted O-methyltransferase YrrM